MSNFNAFESCKDGKIIQVIYKIETFKIVDGKKKNSH